MLFTDMTVGGDRVQQCKDGRMSHYTAEDLHGDFVKNDYEIDMDSGSTQTHSLCFNTPTNKGPVA